MPGFDGTGPLGYGPGAGWGRGPCGSGMARGRYYRRFLPRWGYSPYQSADSEKDFLEGELDNLKNEMNDIKSRLEELKKKNK
jgi:hypothetical protein